MATFDLPLADVTVFVQDMLDTIGVNCTVDGTTAKTMLADLQRTFSNLDENTKQAVFMKIVPIVRGSKVIFDDGSKAIAYSKPNDDLVSYSIKLLMCNATVNVFNYQETYDVNGDIVGNGINDKGNFEGFIERISARERQFDMGILHDAVLRLVTYVGANIQYEDFVTHKGRRYKVIDVDDITEGLFVIQLGSVRA